MLEWKEHAARYEEELKKQNQEEREETKDRVTLSTMHSAKGLEYPVVFVVDANEGSFHTIKRVCRRISRRRDGCSMSP